MQKIAPSEALAGMVEEVIHRRRSTRHFSDTPIPFETLLRLVRAGIASPSGSNTQNQRFLVLTNPEEIAALDGVRFSWPYKSSRRRSQEPDRKGIIANAKAVILVFSDNAKTDFQASGEYFVWQELNVQNCAAAIENILLLATAMGLGSVWISASSKMAYTRMLTERRWAEALPRWQIPHHYGVQGIIALGHPRQTDEKGFPTGERMHGVVWSQTERAEVEAYLIGERREGDPVPSRAAQLQLWLLDQAVRALVRLTSRLDRRIHRIEAPLVKRENA